jgi:predicted site-specific integrase-resolvase
MNAGGVKLDHWLKSVGINRSTGYRWIREGMLKPTNILGFFYITADQDAEFWQRAAAGEFEVIKVKP